MTTEERPRLASAQTALALGTELDLGGPHGVVARARAILDLG